MSNRAAQLDAETKQRHPGATVKRRGRNFIEHDLGGGVTRWTGTIEPLHTRAGAAIDTTWVADTSPWSYRVSAADYTSRIKATFSSAPLLQYANVETGATVSLQPMALNWTNDLSQIQQIAAVQGVTAQLADDLVRWPGAYGAGRDFEYVNHPKRLIKRLVLQSALPAPSASILRGANPCLQLQFIFNWSADATVWIDGALWNKSTAKVTANRIEFRAGDTTVFWFDAPIAYDANGDAAAGVVLRVRKAGNKLYVEVRTPYTWLQSAQYPVTVDPTLTDGYGGDITTSKDTAVNSAAATYNYGSNVTALICDSFGTKKGLFFFDLSSISGDATCNSATLSIFKAAAAGGSVAGAVYAYAIASGNADWPEGSKTGSAGGAGECCWNYYDQTSGSETAWAGSAGLSTSGTDYEASSIGNQACNYSDAIGTEYAISLTAARVEDWFGASNTNYGVLLTNAGRLDLAGLSDNATTGYRPKLVVDYTPPAVSGSPWYAYAQQ